MGSSGRKYASLPDRSDLSSLLCQNHISHCSLSLCRHYETIKFRGVETILDVSHDSSRNESDKHTMVTLLRLPFLVLV